MSSSEVVRGIRLPRCNGLQENSLWSLTQTFSDPNVLYEFDLRSKRFFLRILIYSIDFFFESNPCLLPEAINTTIPKKFIPNSLAFFIAVLSSVADAFVVF